MDNVYTLYSAVGMTMNAENEFPICNTKILATVGITS